MMSGSINRRGAGAYANVGVESGVLAASSHHLITLLFDGAQASLRTARLHMQSGNVEGKCKAISKTLDIVNQGLAAVLDQERGGEVARNLASLYDYVGRLLLQSNLHNDLAKLDLAASLLNDIGGAWRELGTGKEMRSKDEKGNDR